MYAFLLALSLCIWGDDLKQLGNDSFREREAASKQLREAAPFSYFVIAEGLRSQDYEVRARSRHLMDAVHSRLDPLYEAQAFMQALLLVYSPGYPELLEEEAQQIRAGGPRLHKAISCVAKLNSTLMYYSSPFLDSPDTYESEDMVYFVLQLRHVLHGFPYGS